LLPNTRSLRRSTDYGFVKNDPDDFVDAAGLSIWVCVRPAPIGLNILTHAYFYDDTTGASCGRDKFHGPAPAGNNDGAPPGSPGVSCTKVDGSDGKESAVMQCCNQHANDGTFGLSPFGNTCHTSVDNCLAQNGLQNPGTLWIMPSQKRPAQKPVHIFAGIAQCECGQKMYVPSNSPKYICRGCRNKISIADLDGIFCEEIKGYSLSPEAIANYLKSSNETANGKERLIPMQREELQRVRKEIQRTYDLYQQEKLDADGFSKFYTPLEERRKQLEAELPRLEAEVDILKVNALSAEEIASQASNLYDNWQTMKPEEKREIIEVITDKIIIGKDEITIRLYHSPSCKDMAKGARKGWDSNPRMGCPIS
jgi:hypothetical protein